MGCYSMFCKQQGICVNPHRIRHLSCHTSERQMCLTVGSVGCACGLGQLFTRLDVAEDSLFQPGVVLRRKSAANIEYHKVGCARVEDTPISCNGCINSYLNGKYGQM